VREIFRVVKPGGKLIVIAEVYKGANTKMARLCEKHAPRTGMTLLDAKGHRELLVSAGFSDVQVLEEREKGWICAVGTRP